MRPETRSARDPRFGLLLCVAFFLFFEATYLATNYVTELRGARLHLYLPWELAIPFVPQMVLVYLSLNVMLLLTPFVLRTWREIVPLCVAMTGETLVCAVFFLLLPVDLGYAAHGDVGAWGRVCDWVSAVSLRYNNVPSLHVAFAFTAATAFGARCGMVGRRLFLLWAGAIAASTLLIHEHHVIDVAAGVVLALAMRPVYRRVSAGPWLDALRLEVLCLAEFRHFVLRHRRYLFTLIVIYKYSLGRWQQTRILRAGYCLTQHVDDVLDGDRHVGRDPEEYVRELMRQMGGGDYGESFVSSLARYVVGSLGSDSDLRALFDVLLFDRRRLRERLILSGEELREHHRRTFFYSLNLTLMACGAELRAGDAPELISALAWCSVMRDLREDYGKGLVNIPVEVMAGGAMEYEQLVRSVGVRDWIRAEYVRGCEAMERCAARLEGQRSLSGAATLGLFLGAIRVYSRKYARQNRDILSAETGGSLREIRGDGAC